MFKFLLLFFKKPYLNYTLISLIMIIAFYLIFPINNLLGILITYLIPVIYNMFLNFILVETPLINFISNLNIDEYRNKINLTKDSIPYPKWKKAIKINEYVLNYYTKGSNLELIKDIQNSFNYFSNNNKQICTALLFYCFMDNKDIKNLDKLLEKKSINVGLKKLYNLIIQNDHKYEKELLYSIDKKNKKLYTVTIYYFLSTYYNQNKKYELEKKALNKVVELGDKTYMAKNAKKRLKELNMD